jgi:hypothetical protein
VIDQEPVEASSWNIERDGIPDYYLSQPAEAFQRWGKEAAMKAWLEHTEPVNRNRRIYPAPDLQWRSIAIRERDGERCDVCGRGDLPSDRLHTHHKHPFGSGGSHHLKNLVLLCGDCHAEEHRLIEHRRQGRYFPAR